MNFAKDTVETTQLDKFGNIQGFFIQRYKLPKNLSFGALVKVSRFLYLMGGYDTSLNGPTRAVYRSEVLDPLKTPSLELEILIIQLYSRKREAAFPPGTYYYSVSSIFDINDVNNPGGESLPGETLTVYMPPSAPGTILKMKLSWNQIPDAIGYRIYRSISADSSYSQMRLLATVYGNTR